MNYEFGITNYELMGNGKWELVIGKMKEDNVVLEKSYALALRMVKLYGYLTEEKREFVLSKQILRLEEMLKLLGSINPEDNETKNS